MGVRHVFLTGTVSTLTITAWMAGNALAMTVDRNRAIGGLHFNLLLHQRVGL